MNDDEREPDYIFYLTDKIYNEMKRYGDCSDAYQEALQSLDDGFPMKFEIRFLNPKLKIYNLTL